MTRADWQKIANIIWSREKCDDWTFLGPPAVHVLTDVRVCIIRLGVWRVFVAPEHGAAVVDKALSGKEESI